MARFISDQNKVVFLNESGTYASTSGNGLWLGQVMENVLDEKINIVETRFLGGSSRNVSTFEQGPIDFSGKLTYRTQDLRLWGYAIGSMTVTSGANTTTVLAENNNDVRQSAFTSGTLNPPMSFTLEDSKQATGTGKNFIRTINGCIIERATLKVSQPNPVVTELNYIAQNVSYSSGTTTSFASVNANRPYLWADTTLTIGGSVIQTVKDIEFEIDNTSVAPHYLNGSKVVGVPFQTSRNYTLTVTLDADSESINPFFTTFFQSGNSFNVTLDMNADAKQGVTGSMHTIISMSGCRVHDLTTPSPNEGVIEQTLVIRPQTVTATVYDRVVPYTPW